MKNAIDSDKEIILIDSSINDRQIWNYRRYVRVDMTEEQYFNTRDKYKTILKELIDFLITYADFMFSLRRDYISSLALKKEIF